MTAARNSDRLAHLRARGARLGRRALAASPWLWAVALAGLALLVRLSLIFNDFSAAVLPDTGEYLRMANGVISGDGFGAHEYRTPIYPLFIAALSLLPGSTTAVVIVVQHVLGIAVAGAVFGVGDRYFGRIAGIAAGLLTAIAPQQILLEHMAIPDMLFAALLLGAAVAMTEVARSGRPRGIQLVFVGVLFGIATLVKPSGQALVVAAPLVLLFATRSWRATARGAAIVIAAMVLTIAPWVIYNYVDYGHPELSAQGGQALWVRAFDQDKFEIPANSADGRWAQRQYEAYLDDPGPGGYHPNPAELEVTQSYSYVYNALRERGYSVFGATHFQGKLALEAIRRNPVQYLAGTARNIREYVILNAARGELGQSVEQTTFGPLEYVTKALTAPARALSWLGFVLSLSFIGTALLMFVGVRQSRIAAASFLAVGGAIVVGGSLTNYVEPRFAAQVAPLQWVLEAAAAVLVISAIASWIRRQRAESSSA